MTAFELCRDRPELELAPVLRIVKYLGLDSSNLGTPEVDRIVELHPHFTKDPELVVGAEQIAARAGIPAKAVEQLLHLRRREIPFLGTPSRPMVPSVSLELLRNAAAEQAMGIEGPAAAARPANGHPVGPQKVAAAPDSARGRAATSQIEGLQAQLDGALQQVQQLSRTLSSLSRSLREAQSDQTLRGYRPPRRHRRSGGGRPDTIVEACRKVLESASGPLKVSEITARVVSQGVDIRAKNPNVTVSSILSSYEAFERVRRGYYTLSREA